MAMMEERAVRAVLSSSVKHLSLALLTLDDSLEQINDTLGNIRIDLCLIGHALNLLAQEHKGNEKPSGRAREETRAGAEPARVNVKDAD